MFGRWALGLAVFGASCASMALEIIAARMIAPYIGMSLYSWTSIIAVVLAGLALGHWLGGWLADRAQPLRALIAMLLGAALFSAASPYALQLGARALGEGQGPIMAALGLTMAAFFAPSLFAGAVSPIATAAALRGAEAARHGGVLGRFYALGAFGAILGVLAGGLILIPYLGSMRGAGLIAALYALLALPFLPFHGRIALGALTAIFAGLSAAFGGALGPCHYESAYFCIRVDDIEGGGGGAARVLALDHLAHGVNVRDDPLALHSPYVALMHQLARRRFGGGETPDMFFIGGGAYTLPRAWRAYWPGSIQHIAEIDPEVTRIAQERLWFAPDENTHIHHGDARALLARQPDGRFDIVIGDAFADVSIPPHLVSDEFHALVAQKLTPEGVYMMNVVDRLYRPRFLVSLAQTLEARFAHVELWFERAAYSPHERRATWVILASGKPSGVERIVSDDGAMRGWIRVPTSRMLAVFSARDRIFLTDDHAPIARLLGAVLVDPGLAQ